MSGPTLLLVEDDSDTLELTGELLSMSGFRTTHASSLTEACQQLRRTAFDLILTDLMLEPTDTTGALRGIDEMTRVAHLTPVGLVTGAALSAIDAEAHGLVFVLRKPVTRADLLDAIARFTNVPALSRQTEALVRRYFATLETGAWEQLETLCTPDVVYHVPGDSPQFSGEIQGRARFREFAAQTFTAFLEPRFSVTSIQPLPRGAIIRYDGSWLAPGGERQTLSGAMFMRFEGDLIADLGVRLDLEALHTLSPRRNEQPQPRSFMASPRG